MFASSQPGLQYTQSFLKQCFSNRELLQGQVYHIAGGVECAAQVGGPFFPILFGILWFWFFIVGGLICWLVVLSRASCSGHLIFIGRTAKKYKPHMLLQDNTEEQ